MNHSFSYRIQYGTLLVLPIDVSCHEDTLHHELLACNRPVATGGVTRAQTQCTL